MEATELTALSKNGMIRIKHAKTQFSCLLFVQQRFILQQFIPLAYIQTEKKKTTSKNIHYYLATCNGYWLKQ